MNKLILLAVVVAAACAPDTRNDTKVLERKIDDLSKKIDQMIARGGPGAAAPRPARAEPDRAKTYAVPIDGDPVDGPADAKVTLVKAYDYACPYCEKVRDTMDDLRKKYGNDLRIVFKQFVVHPQVATAGALAVCAANKQGKFLQMDKLLWDKGFKGRQFDKDATGDGGQTQKCWDAPAGCPVVLGFAQELGLNADKFKADMKGECQALIQKDQRELQVLGVGATPSFFINGRFLSGAMPIDNFVTLIDEELKKANERIQAGTPAASYYQQVVLDKGLKQLEKPAQ
ncbi:MAG TPA: thioredoxin domain-containing protein [Kofleriaceae bacterium]|nr:thioredoxin domain-containing protein [Kofleriaceae bacterium]